jgi:hypothetical protein
VTTTDDAIVGSLRKMLSNSGRRPDPLRIVEFRPATWQPWLKGNNDAAAVLHAYATDAVSNSGRISRADLAQLSREADAADHATVIRLFAATMIWGSGTSNGRCPRYTASALADARLIPSLIATRQLVLEGRPGAAYARFRTDGVGPSFFTKWFWVSGIDRGLSPTPLILDDRVWASLAALGWDSRVAAASRRRNDRYEAYLESMERWAAAKLPGISTAEQLEQVLFAWSGN